jgi:hypothetical protein
LLLVGFSASFRLKEPFQQAQETSLAGRQSLASRIIAGRSPILGQQIDPMRRKVPRSLFRFGGLNGFDQSARLRLVQELLLALLGVFQVVQILEHFCLLARMTGIELCFNTCTYLNNRALTKGSKIVRRSLKPKQFQENSQHFRIMRHCMPFSGVEIHRCEAIA